jgi:hypothetical protein
MLDWTAGRVNRGRGAWVYFTERARGTEGLGSTMAEGVFGRSDAEIDLLVRGMRSGIAVVGFGGRYEDIPRRIPDSTKAQRKLGWRLHVDVEEGLPSHHRLGAGQPVVPSERLGLRR